MKKIIWKRIFILFFTIFDNYLFSYNERNYKSVFVINIMKKNIFITIICLLITVSCKKEFHQKKISKQDSLHLTMDPSPSIPECNEDYGKEYFYIFDVGQGNMQMALYPRFAVIYDGGSKTSVMPEKIKRLQDINNRIIYTSTSSQEKNTFENQKEKKRTSAGTEGSPQKFTIYNKNENFQNFQSFCSDKVKDILEKKHTSNYYLFVFLSHPDEDHISFWTKPENIVPNKLMENTYVFLCGDWINHSTKTTINVVKALMKKNIKFRFPFLPDLEKHELRNSYIDDDIKLEYKLNIKKNNLDIFSGNINEAFDKFFLKDNLFLKNLEKIKDFEKVYILGLNYKDNEHNVNAHSPILSFDVGDHRFITTGDATPLAIFTYMSNFRNKAMAHQCKKVNTGLGISFSQNSQKKYNPHNNSVLVLPHHGDAKYYNKYVDQQLRSVVGDIKGYVISSGFSKQYYHPSYTLYEQLCGILDEKSTEKIENIFTLKTKDDLGTDNIGMWRKEEFDDSKEEIVKNCYVINTKYPIYNTNVLGDIMFNGNEHNIKTSFSNHCKINDKEKIIDIHKSLESKKIMCEKNVHKNDICIQKNQIFAVLGGKHYLIYDQENITNFDKMRDEEVEEEIEQKLSQKMVEKEKDLSLNEKR